MVLISLILGCWIFLFGSFGRGVIFSDVNQKLGNEMVWSFQGGDGVVVPTAESSNAVGLGPFGQSVALDVFI